MSVILLFDALDDASQKCDHIGLTMLRTRLAEAIEDLEPGQLKALMSQLHREVLAAERLAIAGVIPDKRSVDERRAVLTQLRAAVSMEKVSEQANGLHAANM